MSLGSGNRQYSGFAAAEGLAGGDGKPAGYIQGSGAADHGIGGGGDYAPYEGHLAGAFIWSPLRYAALESAGGRLQVGGD